MPEFAGVLVGDAQSRASDQMRIFNKAANGLLSKLQTPHTIAAAKASLAVATRSCQSIISCRNMQLSKLHCSVSNTFASAWCGLVYIEDAGSEKSPLAH